MVALQARKSTQKLPQHLRDKLAAAVTYYKNHRHQMDYINYTEQHFPIGSGVTEAACKTLIKQRFCLAGMRWKQPGAAGILNLRALVLTAQRFSSILTSASDTLFWSCAISWSMAIISACKSWILKVGNSLFYLAFCQDIPVIFIFTVVFKVDTSPP